MKSRISTLFVTAFFLAFAMNAFVQSAGYDLFQTGSGASIDLGGTIGVVNLMGRPIQGTTGNVDTIIQRTQDVPAGGGSVSATVAALSLQSQGQVNIGNGQTADVYVTVNNTNGTIPQSALPQPDAISPSSGSLSVRTDGTFDSSLTVNANVIFVRPGGNPSNAGDIIRSQAATPISISSTGSSWSSTPPSGYPSASSFPSGGFHPTTIRNHRGPHPVVPGTCGPPAFHPSPSPTPKPSPTPGAAIARPGRAAAVASPTPTPVQACVTSDTATTVQ